MKASAPQICAEACIPAMNYVDAPASSLRRKAELFGFLPRKATKLSISSLDPPGSKISLRYSDPFSVLKGFCENTVSNISAGIFC